MAGDHPARDNPWGWRTLNVLFSAATILVAGLLAYRLTRSLRVSALAQLLLLTDVMFFNISGFAILDPPALFFMTLTLYLYASGRWLLSSIPLGLALLSKSSSILVIPAILGIELAYPVINGGRIGELIERGRRIVRLIIIPALIIFLVGLGIGWRTMPWEDIEGVEAKMELTVRTDADGLHALIHGPIIVHGCASPHEIPIPRPNILIMEGKVMLRIRYRGGEALAEIPLDRYVRFQDALSRAMGRRGRRPGWYEALMDITFY